MNNIYVLIQIQHSGQTSFCLQYNINDIVVKTNLSKLHYPCQMYSLVVR